MSDSSSAQLYFIEESLWGQVPAVSPVVLNEFRFTNESLKKTTETTVSEEIRSTRDVSDIIRTRVGAGGDVGIEFSYGSHDPLLAGLLYDDWSTAVNETGVSVDISLPSPLNNTGFLRITGASPDPAKNIVLGQFIQLGGSAASPTNNGFYKVLAITPASPLTDTILTVTPAPNSAEVIASATLKGSVIKNGTTRKSFIIEKAFTDLSPIERQIFYGMRVGSGELNITPGAVITGSLSFLGKTMVAQNASVGSQTSVLSTADVMNAVDNITDILVDAAPLAADAGCFTNVAFSVNNNLREQPCIGSVENGGIGIGRGIIEGTIEAYFQERSLFEKYLDFTTTSLSFRATLGGNSYIFDFPSIKFIDGEVLSPGNDEDVLVSLQFQGKRDPVSGFQIAITRVPV